MEIMGIFFLGTIVPRKYMPIISAVGLFCYDKFEETPNEKVVNMSKLTKPYFNASLFIHQESVNDIVSKRFLVKLRFPFIDSYLGLNYYLH